MTDITELFARDPLQLEDQDIDAIIARFRESRKAFNLGNMKAGSTKPKTKTEKATAELRKKLGGIDIKL